MALVTEREEFLQSDVPLGTGMVVLDGVIGKRRKERPAVGIRIQMATRDPLKIPCLTDRSFATFPDRRETHLEAAMARVKANPPKGPVPAVEGKGLGVVLAEEEKNNRDGLAWMREKLAG